jgi:DNA polymerase-3 subunit delta'
MRTHLLNVLAKQPLGNYRELQHALKSVTEYIDLIKKHKEQAVKDAQNKILLDHLSSGQQQAVEKELEGLISLAIEQEARMLFETVLSWYRDIQFLLLGGSPPQLINFEFHTELQQAVQRGDFLPLAEVKLAVEQAYLALQRSTSLASCLETLFLKLRRVS